MQCSPSRNVVNTCEKLLAACPPQVRERIEHGVCNWMDMVR